MYDLVYLQKIKFNQLLMKFKKDLSKLSGNGEQRFENAK